MKLKKAVADHYKDKSIHVQYNWWDKNYDVVEVDETEKGHVLELSVLHRHFEVKQK